jgi:uncharacterized membrane protein
VPAGALLYLSVLVWPTPLGALLVTALAAGACCLAVTVLLARRFGARTWRWVLAVPLVLYPFQNWDIFAITALVVGLLAFERRAHRVSGVALGIGAAVKLFPAVVVPVLAAVRWRQHRRDDARRLVAAATVTFVAVNLPVLVLAPQRWWWTYEFQSRRQATWGSAWFHLPRALAMPVSGPTGARVANAVSLVVLLAGMSWLVRRTLRHEIDPYGAAAAAVAIFVVADKVYSPTYDVWLVAFFVMVPLSRRLRVTFCAVEREDTGDFPTLVAG